MGEQLANSDVNKNPRGGSLLSLSLRGSLPYILKAIHLKKWIAFLFYRWYYWQLLAHKSKKNYRKVTFF